MSVALPAGRVPLRVRLAVKRSIDIVGSAALLAVASPGLGAVAAAIRRRMGSPVLFVQERPGLERQPFRMMKFRTMSDEQDTANRLLPDADRLTGLGRTLRAYSLDELPQLFNVLRGDMSLIGPRPLLNRYVPYFSERELARFDVRPGITGWAQIHGRNHVPWDERLALDVWYVEHWSLRLDLLIAARTIAAVLTRQGFAEAPEALMRNLDEERAAVATEASVPT